MFKSIRSHKPEVEIQHILSVQWKKQ